ncbi:MAG: hypothetical protein QXV32_03215 [Conexivisphaerales archaeon]
MVRGDFVLTCSLSDVSRLVELLIQSAKEVKLTREGERLSIEVRRLEMDENLSAKLALLHPDAEISILHDNTKERFEPDLPATLRNILSCPNPNCVTSQPKEPALPEFTVVSRKPAVLLCTYCGRYLHQKDIVPELFRISKKIPS